MSDKMKPPTPDRLPWDYDELDLEIDLSPRFAPWPRRVWLVLACLAGGAILTGALIAFVGAVT